MKIREIKKIFRAKPAIEGAGVHLHRAFGGTEVPQFDPFLLFDDFSSRKTSDYIAGFPWHPHRGIETVTYILEGEVKHQDSMGNAGSIRAGDVQWMTAGSGIIHQEMPQEHPEGIQGFQLWVNLPAKFKMMPPRYQEIQAAEIPLVKRNGIMARIISGNFEGITGPVSDLMAAPLFLDADLEAGVLFEEPITKGHTALVYAVNGSLTIGRGHTPMTHGMAALLGEGEVIQLHAGASGARALVIAGQPIGEPVAWYGPIVMNSEEELKTAFEELQQGTFIKTKGMTA